MMRKLMTVFGVMVLGMALLTTVASAGGPPSGDLVSSIVKAPIVPDGTVAGAATDFVITLDTPLDPSVDAPGASGRWTCWRHNRGSGRARSWRDPT